MYSVPPIPFGLHFWLCSSLVAGRYSIVTLLSAHLTSKHFLFPCLTIWFFIEWAGRLSQWITTTDWWWSMYHFLLNRGTCSAPMTKEARHGINEYFIGTLAFQALGRFLCKDQFSSLLQNESNLLRQRLGIKKNIRQQLLAVCVCALNLQCIYFLPLPFVPCSWQQCLALPVSRDGMQGVLQWKSGFKPNWVCHQCFNFWMVFKHYRLQTQFQQDLFRGSCLENLLWTSFDQQQWP